MKASNTLLAGLIILAAGLVLIISHNNIGKKGIVTTIGILFLISGIINTVLYLSATGDDGRPRHRGASKFFGTIVSVASIFLGLSMLIFVSTFESIIPVLFALLLLFCALIQLYILAWGSRPVRMPDWTYAFPALIFIAAVVVFFANLSEPVLMLVSGCGLTLFGIAGFIEAFLLSTGRRAIRQRYADWARFRPVTDVKDSDIKEITDGKKIKGLDD